MKYLEYLYFVEYSNYRIKKIAPHVCEHYSYPSDKISLILSSFYETTIKTGILDFVVMVESFMCADEPDQLLKEIYRILQYKGKLLLVCENSMGIKRYLLYTLSNIKMKLMRKKSGEIFEHKRVIVGLEMKQELTHMICSH